MSEVLEFKIHGMDCAEEISALKREIGPLVGGESHLSFDLLQGLMRVAADNAISAETIMRAVDRIGMRAELWTASARGRKRGMRQEKGRIAAVALSGLFLTTGLFVHAWLAGDFTAALAGAGVSPVPPAAVVLYGIAIVAGGRFVAPKALLALKRLRPDMNLLMTTAVLGAVALGDWFEAAMVAFLFALALALEFWSIGRTRQTVEALLDLAPPTVRLLLPNHAEREVPPEQVPTGTLFFVKPGERIALDGEVVRGASEVNQAPITGESLPAPKGPGDAVFAGTVNGTGALDVRSTRIADDTTLAHITRLVGEAQRNRSPSEQWVDKFARVYTPAVMSAAILTLLLPPLVAGGNWEEWIYRALVLLVIACPCALVISTPVSIVAALAASARNGVLIKGGPYVELPAKLKAIAFDKTGTLTEGTPAVVGVAPFSGISETELLRIAASLEARSEHPIARAIVSFALAKGVAARMAEDFRAIQGKGATASVDGRICWIGSHRSLAERCQETKAVQEQVAVHSGPGRTIVIVGEKERALGLIVLADRIRPESAIAIGELRQLGIQRVVMLTGDDRITAEAIAWQSGVDEVRAELLPKDKVAVMKELVQKYGCAAMAGDGINDGPAMAQANLGIAMGAIGSDAAIEAADVALMSDDLLKIPWLVRHGRRTLKVIRQNVGLSLTVKAVFVTLTFAGFASLWAAIAADMGISLLVLFNALRLIHGGGHG